MKNIFNKINCFYVAIVLFVIIAVLHIDIITAPLGYYFSHFDLKDLNYYINIRQYVVDSLLSGVLPFWTTRLFAGYRFLQIPKRQLFICRI